MIQKGRASAASFRQLMRNVSRDVIPNIDNYKISYQKQTSMRPTLQDLCDPSSSTVNEEISLEGFNEVDFLFK